MSSILKHPKKDFLKMHEAGKLAAQVLDYINDFIEPDITTNYLNDLCHQFIIENNAIPAPLNYKGFPKSICTSVNHVVCHGIPANKILKSGDIINIDITVTSTLIISPSFNNFLSDGIPWQTTWLTEVQIDLGKPL